MRFEYETLKLTIVSRSVDITIAGRISVNSFDFRTGLSWSMDFRSFSTTPLSDRFEAEPDGLRVVNALVPFVSAAWVFHDRVCVFGRVGTSLALNETNYGTDREGKSTQLLEPFFAKLVYHLGAMLLI
jgi:hypothetical protein